jgi:DNA-binding transcriptional LysR family regulator
VGEKLLPDILAEFHRLHPTLELCLYEAASQNLLTLLDSGEIDLAILTLPNDPRGLRLTSLFKEKLVLVVGLNHPLSNRTEVAFTELAAESFLLDYPGRIRDTTLEACRRSGFTPRIVLNGGSVEMLLRLTRTGLGVTLLPELAVKERRGLAILNVSDQILEREMVLALSEVRIQTTAITAMRDFLANNLARS